MKRKGKSIHYAWVICLGCTIALFVSAGVASNCFSVYLPYIVAENSFRYAQGSFLFALRFMVGFFVMLEVDKYYRWFSLRTGLFFSVLMGAVAFMGYGFAKSYAAYCAAAIVNGICYGLASMVPISILISRWFHRKRNLALGICAAGSGLAAVVMPGPITRMIEAISLRGAFLAVAGFLALLACLVWLLLRDDPEDKHLPPYGEIPVQLREKPKPVSAPSRGLSHREWLQIGTVCLLMGAVCNVSFNHLSMLFSTEGYESLLISRFVSVAGLSLALGKILCGRVADSMGGAVAGMGFCLLVTVSNGLCYFTTGGHPVFVAGVCVVIGIGYAIGSMGASIWSADLTSGDRYPSAVKLMQALFTAGALVFGVMPGLIADITGSYHLSYLIFSLMGAAALVLQLLTYRGRHWNGNMGARKS